MVRKPLGTVSRDILIERNSHYCKVTHFLPNLAHLFQTKSELLLCSKYLDVDKKVYFLQAHNKMLKFCKSISNFQHPNSNLAVRTRNIVSNELTHVEHGADYLNRNTQSHFRHHEPLKSDQIEEEKQEDADESFEF